MNKRTQDILGYTILTGCAVFVIWIGAKTLQTHREIFPTTTASAAVQSSPTSGARYHRSPDGKYHPDAGCHWVNPNIESDLSTDCNGGARWTDSVDVKIKAHCADVFPNSFSMQNICRNNEWKALGELNGIR